MSVTVKKSKKAITKRIVRNVTSNSENIDLAEKCRQSLYADWASLWRKGFPFHYHNKMTDQLGDTYSVEANPDGSEDLVRMTYDSERVYHHFERHLCGKGEGKYYPILNNFIFAKN